MFFFMTEILCIIKIFLVTLAYMIKLFFVLLNPFPAKLFYLNFHPLEVVSHLNLCFSTGTHKSLAFVLLETKHLQILMFKHTFHSK